ncbi:MAG: IS256 family transposase [Planctomycetes bacterium]|nr:IS256 family transposase [Planctomycetota bacterium]
MRGILKLDAGKVESHLDVKVRQAVEQVLNDLLDAEADELCGAKRYERSPDRLDTRAGHYVRGLHTKAGEVSLKMPKLRQAPFETAIIERYRRKQASVEEALVEMYLAGVSVRRVEDITEALWGARVSSSTVSELNQRIYGRIEEWRTAPIEGEPPYIYLDGLWLKRSWGGEVRNVSVLVAVGVNQDGFRDILGVAEGAKEDAESWRNFLRYLKDRGLKGVRLVVSDKCLGLVEAQGEFFPEASWQRCTVHFYRNVMTSVPTDKVKEVMAAVKAIHAQEDRPAALAKAEAVALKLEGMKLKKAAEAIRSGAEETLAYQSFPREHWRSLRTNNPLERLNREIRRRTRAVGAFPDGQSALMLVCARLRHMTTTRWGQRRYLNMRLLAAQDAREARERAEALDAEGLSAV